MRLSAALAALVLPAAPLTAQTTTTTTDVYTPSILSAAGNVTDLPGGNALCGSMRVRKPWDALTSAEQALYLEATEVALADGGVASFASIAAESVGQAQGDYTCAFFSWYRRLLLAYESYLRALDDRFACLTLPYYDVHTAFVQSVNGECTNLFECSDLFQALGGAPDASTYTTVAQDGYNVTGYRVTGTPYTTSCDDATCTTVVRNNLTSKAVPSAASFSSFQSVVATSYDYATFLENIKYGIHNEVLDALGGTLSTSAAAQDVLFYSWYTSLDMYLHVYHLCRIGVPLTYTQIVESREAFANATQTCGGVSGVDADSSLLMRISVNGSLVDVSEHPTLGPYFGYVGNENWNYADIQQLGDYSYTYQLPELVRQQILSNNDMCPGFDRAFAASYTALNASTIKSTTTSKTTTRTTTTKTTRIVHGKRVTTTNVTTVSTRTNTSATSSYQSTVTPGQLGSSYHGYTYLGNFSTDNVAYGEGTMVSNGYTNYVPYFTHTEVTTKHNGLVRATLPSRQDTTATVVTNVTVGVASVVRNVTASVATSGQYWTWVQTAYDGLHSRFQGNVDLVATHLMLLECYTLDQLHMLSNLTTSFVTRRNLVTNRVACGQRLDLVRAGLVPLAVRATSYSVSSLTFANASVIQTILASYRRVTSRNVTYIRSSYGKRVQTRLNTTATVANQTRTSTRASGYTAVTNTEYLTSNVTSNTQQRNGRVTTNTVTTTTTAANASDGTDERTRTTTTSGGDAATATSTASGTRASTTSTTAMVNSSTGFTDLDATQGNSGLIQNADVVENSTSTGQGRISTDSNGETTATLEVVNGTVSPMVAGGDGVTQTTTTEAGDVTQNGSMGTPVPMESATTLESNLTSQHSDVTDTWTAPTGPSGTSAPEATSAPDGYNITTSPAGSNAPSGPGTTSAPTGPSATPVPGATSPPTGSNAPNGPSVTSVPEATSAPEGINATTSPTDSYAPSGPGVTPASTEPNVMPASTRPNATPAPGATSPPTGSNAPAGPSVTSVPETTSAFEGTNATASSAGTTASTGPSVTPAPTMPGATPAPTGPSVATVSDATPTPVKNNATMSPTASDAPSDPSVTPDPTGPTVTPAPTGPSVPSEPNATPAPAGNNATNAPISSNAPTGPSVAPANESETCINVSVEHDATYCIEGPICSGSGESPAGSLCPKMGDRSVQDCHETLASYSSADSCVAPVDAVCAKIETGAWGCVFEAVTPAPTTLNNETSTSGSPPTATPATSVPSALEGNNVTTSPTESYAPTGPSVTPVPMGPSGILVTEATPAPAGYTGTKASTDVVTSTGPSVTPAPTGPNATPAVTTPDFTPAPEGNNVTTLGPGVPPAPTEPCVTPAPTGPSVVPAPGVTSTPTGSNAPPGPSITSVPDATSVPATMTPTETNAPAGPNVTPAPTGPSATPVYASTAGTNETYPPPAVNAPTGPSATPAPTTPGATSAPTTTLAPAPDVPAPSPDQLSNTPVTQSSTRNATSEQPAGSAPTPCPTTGTDAPTTESRTQSKSGKAATWAPTPEATSDEMTQQVESTKATSFASTSSDSNRGLSSAAILGIVATVCAAVAVAGVTVYRVRHRRNDGDVSPSVYIRQRDTL